MARISRFLQIKNRTPIHDPMGARVYTLLHKVLSSVNHGVFNHFAPVCVVLDPESNNEYFVRPGTFDFKPGTVES